MVTIAPFVARRSVSAARGEQEGAGQVGRQHARPFRQAERRNWFPDHEAGVADQCVQPAFRGCNALDQGTNGSLVGYIRLHGPAAGRRWIPGRYPTRPLRQPSLARRVAIPAPIPFAAPVTRAVRIG